MWIKNKSTGLKWEVDEKRYNELIATGEYMPVIEDAPAPKSKTGKAAKDAKPD